jgi:organic radical activating enzyme
MPQSVYVKEIFKSIQGEAEYVGYEQIFVRFIGCNIKCNYCDTDIEKCEELKLYKNWDSKEYKVLKNPLESLELIEAIEELDLEKNVHSISLTGGEPLINIKFLEEFLPEFKKIRNTKIFLETNGTLQKELHCIAEYVDIVSMDLKLASYLENRENLIQKHSIFLKECMENNIATYVKIVLDNNFSLEEFNNYLKVVEPYKHKVNVYIQPMMDRDKMLISSEKLKLAFDQCKSRGLNPRIIPQVHRMLCLN